MKRLGWATDIHLDSADEEHTEAFLRSVLEADPDALLVGGDIGQADSVGGYLEAIAKRIERPLYFVLGNHDFYGGAVATVRAEMRALSQSSRWLRWLPAAGIVALSERTALVGHDGWADGRVGNGTRSQVMLNDYLAIRDLAAVMPWKGAPRDVDEVVDGFRASQDARFAVLAALGDEAAAHVRSTVPAALERFEHVVFLTHPPPFREACWHEGRISDDEWQPHMTCKAVGDALRDALAARPDRAATVLCGHTHGAGEVDILANLHVKTGGARYRYPTLQRLVGID